MSFASFSYALLDIYQFINGPGVAVVTIFSSIALGGLFSIVERFLDLREKKEL